MAAELYNPINPTTYLPLSRLKNYPAATPALTTWLLVEAMTCSPAMKMRTMLQRTLAPD
jgi:hypothetical protein